MVITLSINKHTVKRFFTTQLFIFAYKTNNITELFLTDINLLYTKNRLHNESMSLTNGIWNIINTK